MNVTIYDEKGLTERIYNVIDIAVLPDDKMHLYIYKKDDPNRHKFYIPLIAHMTINFNKGVNEDEEKRRS